MIELVYCRYVKYLFIFILENKLSKMTGNYKTYKLVTGWYFLSLITARYGIFIFVISIYGMLSILIGQYRILEVWGALRPSF